MTKWQTFAFRLPLITALLCAIAGALIFGIGSWQTKLLADQESRRIGQALAAQLAETVRQPLLHNDLVSLQVSVEQLVERAEVAGASVYNARQKPLAQSKSGRIYGAHELVTWREPLTVEGTVTAYAGVDIDIGHLHAVYRKPFNWILSLWAAFALLMTVISAWTGRKLSERLSGLTARLPGDPTLDEAQQPADELDKLEQQLQPLLTQSAKSDDTAEPTRQVATLALHCKNLESLEKQLSKENLQRLLNQLDADLKQVTTLYDGKRLPGHNQTLFVEFSGGTENGNHPLQALFSAHLLMELSKNHAHALGASPKLSAAISLRNGEDHSSLMGDFEREKRKSATASLASMGDSGETLLDSQVQLHQSFAGVIDTEQLSEDGDIHRVASFSTRHSTLLAKQLHYLTRQPDPAT